ncbi:MAG: hypothetical protein WCI73_14070 [Phycisphaerae bacterium]
MKRWFLKLRIPLALLLIAFLVVHWGLNTALRREIRITAEASLGQKVALNAATLRWRTGILVLNDFQIQNPPGYALPNCLAVRQCDLDIYPLSLASDTVNIDDITIDGLQLAMEQDVIRNNIQEVLAGIKRIKAAHPADRGKQLNIVRLRLTNTQLLISLRLLPGVKPDVKKITLPPLEFDHPMGADGKLLRIGGLTTYLLEQLTIQAANQPHVDTSIRLLLKNISAALATEHAPSTPTPP